MKSHVCGVQGECNDYCGGGQMRNLRVALESAQAENARLKDIIRVMQDAIAGPGYDLPEVRAKAVHLSQSAFTTDDSWLSRRIAEERAQECEEMDTKIGNSFLGTSSVRRREGAFQARKMLRERARALREGAK
jgi:hypothetical protein